MSAPFDDAAARALGVLATRPDADDAALRKFLEGPARDEAAVAAARARFAAGETHWMRCTGDACQPFPELPEIGAGSPCLTTDTGCMGLCEHAPVGVARIGTRCETFSGYDGAEQRVGAYLRRAASAGHAFVADEGALAYRLDPIHGPAGPCPLAPFAFLVGHFRGEGRYARGDARFFKELVGSWGAGQRALTLLLSVGFPLRDGRRDQHEALITIRGDDEQGWSGAAIEDGGRHATYHYALETDGSVSFDDRPPGHGDTAQRARKTLSPTPSGYVERLEVERDGAFTLYSEVDMVRVGSEPAPTYDAASNNPRAE